MTAQFPDVKARAFSNYHGLGCTVERPTYVRRIGNQTYSALRTARSNNLQSFPKSRQVIHVVERSDQISGAMACIQAIVASHSDVHDWSPQPAEAGTPVKRSRIQFQMTSV